MDSYLKVMDLINYDESIPVNVKVDILKRINDWCVSGGSMEDPYIERQLSYLLRVKEYHQ